ncbi:MAG TPA: lipopolysaccharide transport periplasmic protein LptA [Gammaproteobacteria bacterium]|jgi:lipopolysaccharide export system protein LptA|nr:lipopolysaccharide transport periplasmic protein LptA [Gammaproteobacteria bacterium]
MHNGIKILLLLLSGITAVSVFALPGDSKEMLHIKADSTIINYKRGTKYFQGNVIVDQGTTHITADRMTTKENDKHLIEEAIAYGINDLAHFWTTPKAGEQVVDAHAKIIKFYPITHNATLQSNVHVMQGENNFQGQLIHYNMNDQTIIVPETKNGRAVIVYNPD